MKYTFLFFLLSLVLFPAFNSIQAQPARGYGFPINDRAIQPPDTNMVLISKVWRGRQYGAFWEYPNLIDWLLDQQTLADTAAAIRSDLSGGGASLPSGSPAEVITYDGNSTARTKYIGNAWNLPAKGIVAHIGDSNTNGRPGYRDAVNEEFVCSTCVLKGWTSYNVGQNGSTLDGWVNSIGTASHKDSLLYDFGPAGSDAAYQYAPGANVWRAVNGDTSGRKPDFIIISLGTNDIRNAQNRNDIGSYSDLKSNLDALVNFYLDTTDYNILLAIPQPVAFTPSGGFDGEWTDQAEADAYSDTLRQVYNTWQRAHPRVQVYDSQEDIFGFSVDDVTTDAQDAITGADLMADILHPTPLGYRRKIQGIAKQIAPAYFRPSRRVYSLPEDAYKNAVWGRIYRSRSSRSAQSLLELETTPMGRVEGRNFVIDEGTGRTEDKFIHESANLAGLEAIYQELRDLASDSPDTTYLYFLVSGNTYKATNVTFNQYIDATASVPGWAQFTFAGISATESAGPVLIYIKSQNKIPLSPAPSTLNSLSDVDAASPANNEALVYNSGSGNWENTAVPSGTGLAGRPAYWNTTTTISAIDDSHISGSGFAIGGTTTNGLLNVHNAASGTTIAGNKPTLFLQQDRNFRAIQIQANVNADQIYAQRSSGNGWFINTDINTGQGRGINIDLDDTGTYLFNTDTYGLQIDVRDGIDQDWLYGAYIRADKTRTSVGTNDGHTAGLEVRARSSIATVGESWVARFIAETGTTTNVLISSPSGATAPALQVSSNGGTRFQVIGNGEIDVDAPVLDDADSPGNAGQVLLSQGSALADAPLWDSLQNAAVLNPYGGQNDLGGVLDSVYLYTLNRPYGELFNTQANGNTIAITAATPQLINGTNGGNLNSFTHSAGRLTYNGGGGTITVLVNVSLSGSFSVAASDIDIQVYKNGGAAANLQSFQTMTLATDIETISVSGIVKLSNGDYLELFADSTASGTLSIESLDFSIIQI